MAAPGEPGCGEAARSRRGPPAQPEEWPQADGEGQGEHPREASTDVTGISQRLRLPCATTADKNIATTRCRSFQRTAGFFSVVTQRNCFSESISESHRLPLSAPSLRAERCYGRLTGRRSPPLPLRREPSAATAGMSTSWRYHCESVSNLRAPVKQDSPYLASSRDCHRGRAASTNRSPADGSFCGGRNRGAPAWRAAPSDEGTGLTWLSV